jgi:hypothetical protein
MAFNPLAMLSPKSAAPKKSWDEACADASVMVTEALKFLTNEPAIMAYFGLLDLRPVKDEQVTVRLATKGGNSVAGLEYNPYFINTLDDPSELAQIFYGESLRLALHHCTTRYMNPCGVNMLSSDLICFEDLHILSRWKDPVKLAAPQFPTYAQVKPVLDKYGFDKSKQWIHEQIFNCLCKEANAQNQQRKEKLEKLLKEAMQQMQKQRQQQQQKNGQGQKDQQQNGQGQQGQDGQPQDGNQQQGQGQNGQDQQDQQNGQGQQQQQQGQGQGQDQNQSQGQGQGNGNGQSQENGQQGQDQQGQGSGSSGSPSDGLTDEQVKDLMNQIENIKRDTPDLRQKPKSQSQAGSALDRYFDNSEANGRTKSEKWGENDSLDDKIQEITEHIAADSSRWGNVSGMLKQMILEANAPRFDPTTVVKHFKQEIQSEQMESTRSRRNRRTPYLPGWRHKMKSSILFAIDCSGSMSDDDVALGEAFVNKFIKHAQVSYCFWDGVCGDITDLKRKEKNFELVGRGCTNPQCVLDKLEEEGLDYGGIIFFTDNGFCWDRPKSKWARKVFIISTHNADACPPWVRYHLSMDDIEDYNKR